MSASERLKVLPSKNAHGHLNQESVQVILSALPEVIAVVEAAEQIERGPIFVGSRLGDELAALEAKLTTKGER